MKRVVLFSGGVDSTLLLALAGDDATPLFIDYGQPAMFAELRAARRIAAHRLVTMRSYMPLGRMGTDERGLPGPRVVPGRNLVLISLAVSLAAANGAGEVWLGATADDGPDYRDCTRAFVDSACVAAAEGYGVLVQAPLIHATRRDIVAQARQLGVSLEDCWSCYCPHLGTPCGTCNACMKQR